MFADVVVVVIVVVENEELEESVERFAQLYVLFQTM